MIWFTSDLHFCHNRDFLYKNRGFDNVYDMNIAIVKNWNAVVQPEDEVYVLGDLMLNDNEEGLKLIKQLNGNIHIILGNHDTNERVKLYRTCENVKTIQYAFVLSYGGYHFYLSHYPSFTAHIDTRPPKRERINLFGHTHQETNFFCFHETGAENVFMYHVGLNSHNCTPVSIETVIHDINEKYKSLHPDFQIPELIIANPTSEHKLTEEYKEIQKKKQQKNEEFQLALQLAKEIVTGEVVTDACIQNNINVVNSNISDIMHQIAPYIYQKLLCISSDEMRELGDYAGKAVQHIIVQKVQAMIKKKE